MFNLISRFGAYGLWAAGELIKTIVWQIGRFFLFLWKITSQARQRAFAELKLLLIVLLSPLVRMTRFFHKSRDEIQHAAANKGMIFGVGAWLKAVGHAIFGKRGFAVTVFNLAAPIVSVVFLFNIVSYASTANYAVRLEVGGVFLGYVENEQVFTQAEIIVAQRLSEIGAAGRQIAPAKFTIENAGSSELLSPYRIAELLFSQMGVTMEYAYGVFVNDRLIGAVKDNTRIKTTLESLLDRYRTGDPDEEVKFVWDIDVDQNKLYTADFIVEDQAIVDLFTSTKQQEQYYQVQLNDTPSGIAAKLNLSQAEIEALNPGFYEDDLYVGEHVLSAAQVPYLAVSITRTEVYDVMIPYETDYQDSDSLYVGQQKVISLGSSGLQRVTARVSQVNGIENHRQIIGRTVLVNPVSEIVYNGIKPTPAGSYSTERAAYGKFIWPISQYSGYISELTQADGGYWGHGGVDFAAPTGTPIYAVDAGTVSLAASNYGGYGMCVMIDHPGGLRTLYGHMSAIYVSVGETVAQGQCIGLVGETGKAYGSHVHLEVRQGNTRLNPINFITY
jgi:murein DD-endopeptidase MepM/ murein hydrolase activator NlpD